MSIVEIRKSPYGSGPLGVAAHEIESVLPGDYPDQSVITLKSGRNIIVNESPGKVLLKWKDAVKVRIECATSLYDR